MILYSNIPLLAILVSMAAAILILLNDKNPDMRETITFIAAAFKIGLVYSLIPAVMNGNTIVFSFFELFPGVRCGLSVDALGLFFAIVSSTLWIVTSIYSVGYMRTLKEKKQTRYFASFALSLSAAIGIAFSGDLLTFFIFYELLTLATYPLVIHKETEEAVRSGRKYLTYALGSGALLLCGIAWIYTRTGTLEFQPGGILSGQFDGKELLVLLMLLSYGFGMKAALFPLQEWLPSAMVAPTPVSALLHAVAVVKAGVFGILRMVGFVFGPSILKTSGLWQPLALVAGFTILFASCIALTQNNLKKRLAYSTISQLSYIVLGAALVSPDAYTGAVLHLSNHAMMKITLFFCAGVIYGKTHLQNIDEMKGIGYKLPITFTVFTFGVLGLSGFPLFCGFISKWYLGTGAVQAGHPWYLFFFLASALLNAAYFLPVIITAFQKTGNEHLKVEAAEALTIPPWFTGILILVFGCIPVMIHYQLNLAGLITAAVFGG